MLGTSLMKELNEIVASRNVRRGYLYFQAPALCLDPSPGPRSWPPICIYRPWPQFFFYRPWSVRGLGLHIPTLSPQFVFAGPGLRLLFPCSDFAFTFLSIVVAVAVVILALVVTS